MNISTFNDVKPEEFLTLMRNFKIVIDGTGRNSPSGWIKYLHTMLRGSSLREYDELSLQLNINNNHLKHITGGLPDYFPP